MNTVEIIAKFSIAVVFIQCHCYWTGGVVSRLEVARSKSRDSIPERFKKFSPSQHPAAFFD